MNLKRLPVRTALALGLAATMVLTASADRRPVKKEGSPVSVLDSTEGQWGVRSINDSVYRGYTVNAVYLERGRQRLPDSFHMYRPTPIDSGGTVTTETSAPTTIRVNGVEQRIPEK